MARIRTIKPEMAQDEDLAECSIEAQLLAVRILNHADDEGFFKANINLIKANCFPLVNLTSVKIQGMLSELSKIGYIRLFKGSDGKEYGAVSNFSKHQNINRPSKSKISPLEPGNGNEINDESSDDEKLTENSVNIHGDLISGKERKGKEQGKDYCSEPEVSEPPVIEIPTNKFNTENESYPVYESQVETWNELFPAVNVIQSLRECKAWNLANPGKRKTYSGMAKHITTWLSREQNKPHPRQPNYGAQVYQHPSAAQQRTPASHRSLKEIVAEQEARRD